MYKEATKVGLRIQTTKGLLSAEQLWHLNVEELDTLAVKLEEDYKNSKSKSFLDKKTTKDKYIKLQFDLVLDILQTKVEENDSFREAKENKDYNEKIMTLIKEKEEDSLKELDVKDLKALLKK